MMFYGIEATPLGMYQAEQLCCSKCGGENSVKMKVFARYFHVSRIPSFPMGKIGVAVCQTCNHSVDNQGFSHLQHYQLAFKQIEKKTSIPYWSCAGLGVLLTLMGLAGYSLLGL